MLVGADGSFITLTHHSHLQNVTVDNAADLQCPKRGIEIRRPKQKEEFSE